jgi:formylglycine-generating enzyme required for sulfatase activity
VRSVEAERALRPGDLFQECPEHSGVCPEMIVVPASDGAVSMGSPDGKGNDDEHPRHEVRIAAPFAVGRFEVTWDEWETCVAMRGCNGGPTGDQSYGKGRRPVINVSWDQAKAYVAWLSGMTGKDYRLLTEAEWEYAARGVTNAGSAQGDDPWGNDPAEICRYANVADHSYLVAGYTGGTADCDDGVAETASVGSYPANAFGLHDMHGNVWEWGEDCYHPDYKGAPDNGSAWIEGGDCKMRMMRGGAWNYPPGNVRSAHRNWLTSENRYFGLGFRVARTLATP